MKLFLCFLWLPWLLFSQQTATVDFQRIEAKVTPDMASKSVTGTVKVEFLILQATDSIFLDAHSMTLTEQALEGVPVVAANDKIWLQGPFEANRNYTAFFSYSATPKQTMYFATDQIWTQGQGKYTSHWLPSIDDMNDKIEFDLEVLAEEGQTVIANGDLQKFILYDDRVGWKFDMKQPMSSYLVAFAMGDFTMKKLTSATDIPIELYISRKDSLHWEPTYRYSKEIFDFLEAEIGVPYPWQNYKQVPVYDFLYAGMENTGATIFSEAFVTDSIAFKDRNYVNVNAHELAHQWFGNLVTETSGTHHWLHEGFATYYALLAEREIFGEDYYYWKLYNTAEQLKAISDQGKGQRLLDPQASSLTFYEKGAWALHMLRELIGDQSFRAAVKDYLEANAYGNVKTQDFIESVQANTTIDVTQWEKDWLRQTAFKAEQAYNSLKRSLFMRSFFEISALRNQPIEAKRGLLRDAIKNGNEYLGQEAVYQLANESYATVSELYSTALRSKSWLVRQAVAVSMDEISEYFRERYETLLDDPSYLTQEAALYNLWLNFPEHRERYLQQTKHLEGFQDKNIRILWLVFAVTSEYYSNDKRLQLLDELSNYGSNEYSFEVREKALQYLYSIGVDDSKFVKNLVNACTHHYWRFRNTARNILDEFVKNPSNKEKVLSQYGNFSDAEKAYLKRKFNF